MILIADVIAIIVLADVMPKVVADVMPLKYVVCGRWKATVADVVTTQLGDWQM